MLVLWATTGCGWLHVKQRRGNPSRSEIGQITDVGLRDPWRRSKHADHSADDNPNATLHYTERCSVELDKVLGKDAFNLDRASART